MPIPIKTLGAESLVGFFEEKQVSAFLKLG